VDFPGFIGDLGEGVNGMVKLSALLLAAIATLVVVDSAQARGRRGGCPGGNCYAVSSCANGSCYVGSDYHKTAAIIGEGPAIVEAAPSTSVGPVAVQPAPRYTSNVRRGWFARRR
jgi:hypothetical protein